MNENRIGIHQLTILVTFFGIGASILIAPGPLAVHAKQAAWLASIIGVLASMLPIAVYWGLSRRYPKQSLVEMNESVFGRWIGMIVSSLYIVFFLLICALLLGDLGYFLTTEVMPETPIDFIMACLIVVVVMAVRLGPEVMARAAEIFFPWAMILFGLLVLLLLPQIELRNIQPVLEDGLKPVFEAALTLAGLQEYVVLLMILPFVKVSKKRIAAFTVGALLAGAVFVIIMVLCLLVLGPSLTSFNMYPSFTLAKKINVGNFLQRVEVIIGGLWFITITFKLMLTFFAAVKGTAELFRFTSYSFLTWPMGVFILSLVLITYTNIVFVIDLFQRVWPAFAFTFILGLPLLTLLVSLMRKPQSV